MPFEPEFGQNFHSEDHLAIEGALTRTFQEMDLFEIMSATMQRDVDEWILEQVVNVYARYYRRNNRRVDEGASIQLHV